MGREIITSEMDSIKGTRIPLTAIPNARDLGGYKTLEGKRIKPKKLIRSGTLGALIEEDIRILVENYNLKTIIDLRTDAERSQNPDPEIPGVVSYHNPILRDETFGITKESEKTLSKEEFDYSEMLLNHVKMMGENEDSLASLYAEFVESEYALEHYRKFLLYVLEQEEGAILWHCTAGKDRVGTSTAILLRILGVDMETIFNDFLLTNEFLKEQTEQIVKQVSEKTTDERVLKLVAKLNGVDKSYLEAFFDTIEKDYGSFDEFIRTKMNMTGDKIHKLKEKYLV